MLPSSYLHCQPCTICVDGIHIIHCEQPFQDGLIHLKSSVIHLQKNHSAKSGL